MSRLELKTVCQPQELFSDSLFDKSVWAVEIFFDSTFSDLDEWRRKKLGEGQRDFMQIRAAILFEPAKLTNFACGNLTVMVSHASSKMQRAEETSRWQKLAKLANAIDR